MGVPSEVARQSVANFASGLGVADWAAAVSAVVAAVAVLLTLAQLRSARKATAASVFLGIWTRWNEIYEPYRKLTIAPIRVPRVETADELRRFLATEEWREARQVFSFYEFVGSSVRSGILDERTAFSIVTFNKELWENHADEIAYVRKVLEQKDLYLHWQLVTKWKGQGFFGRKVRNLGHFFSDLLY